MLFIWYFLSWFLWTSHFLYCLYLFWLIVKMNDWSGLWGDDWLCFYLRSILYMVLKRNSLNIYRYRILHHFDWFLIIKFEFFSLSFASKISMTIDISNAFFLAILINNWYGSIRFFIRIFLKNLQNWLTKIWNRQSIFFNKFIN